MPLIKAAVLGFLSRPGWTVGAAMAVLATGLSSCSGLAERAVEPFERAYITDVGIIGAFTYPVTRYALYSALEIAVVVVIEWPFFYAAVRRRGLSVWRALGICAALNGAILGYVAASSWDADSPWDFADVFSYSPRVSAECPLRGHVYFVGVGQDGNVYRTSFQGGQPKFVADGAASLQPTSLYVSPGHGERDDLWSRTSSGKERRVVRAFRSRVRSPGGRVPSPHESPCDWGPCDLRAVHEGGLTIRSDRKNRAFVIGGTDTASEERLYLPRDPCGLLRPERTALLPGDWVVAEVRETSEMGDPLRSVVLLLHLPTRRYALLVEGGSPVIALDEP